MRNVSFWVQAAEEYDPIYIGSLDAEDIVGHIPGDINDFRLQAACDDLQKMQATEKLDTANFDQKTKDYILKSVDEKSDVSTQYLKLFDNDAVLSLTNA